MDDVRTGVNRRAIEDTRSAEGPSLSLRNPLTATAPSTIGTFSQGDASRQAFRSADKLWRRFWSKVRIGDGCWEWVGATRTDGRGVVRHQGKLIKAYRRAWELVHGPIPEREGHHGACVCHHCDNPSCVRPSHLFVGTQGDNMRDRDRKGRGVIVYGPKHGRSKLTPEAVRHIRASKGRVKELAARYGVSESTVRSVRKGAWWNNLEVTP